jgi:hypothetical protein
MYEATMRQRRTLTATLPLTSTHDFALSYPVSSFRPSPMKISVLLCLLALPAFALDRDGKAIPSANEKFSPS